MLYLLIFALTGKGFCETIFYLSRVSEKKSQDVNLGDDVTIMWPNELGNGKGFKCSKDAKALFSTDNVAFYTKDRTYTLDSKQKRITIENVTVNDNGLFKCQVTANKVLISAALHLNVLVPPTAVEIKSYTNESTINITENRTLKLSCAAYNASPPVEIQWWYRNGERPSKIEEQFFKTGVIGNGTLVRSTLSNLTWPVRKKDNGGTLICEARHKSATYVQSVSLNVTYVSSTPVLNISKSNVVAGDKVTLSCSVRGGNPLPELKLYNGSQELMGNSSFNYNDNMTVVKYTIIVSAVNDGTKYKCVSSNDAGNVEASLNLTVQYPPSEVTIDGGNIVYLNHPANFTCKTKSNPKSSFVWTLNDQSQKRNTFGPFDDNGTTKSILSVNGTEHIYGQHEMKVKCVAQNIVGTVGKEIFVTVYSPPGKPEITSRGTDLVEDASVSFVCSADSGYPPANVAWYLSYRKLGGSKIEHKEDRTVESVINLKLNRDMNRKVLRCEAVNKGMNASRSAEYLLNVSFGPNEVVVKNPGPLKAGVLAKLECQVYSSNPKAEVTWELPGLEKPTLTTKENNLENGGVNVVSYMEFVPTKKMNGVAVACCASSSKWAQKRSSEKFLDVQYSPEVENLVDEFVVNETQPFDANFTFRANPHNLGCSWKKNNVSFYHKIGSLTASGPTLKSERLLKNDTGIYELFVTNGVGNTTIFFKLLVQYGAAINRISKDQTAFIGEKIVLSCDAEGVPSYSDMINWYHENILVSRGVAGDGGHKNLSFTASERMSGKFVCVADNGIGRSRKEVRVLVDVKPQIYKGSKYNRAAGAVGRKVPLECHARGYPPVNFTWYDKEFREIKPDNNLYSIRLNSENYPDYKSTLFIERLQRGHYNHSFVCVAENKIGNDTLSIKITQPSSPDIPLNLTCLHSTRNSITLKWVPGFDGGSQQKFDIHLLSAEGAFNRSFVTTEESITINNLSSAEQYEVAVRSWNNDGFVSRYSPYLTVFTRNSNGEDVGMVIRKADSFSTLLLLLLGIGVLLLSSVNFVLFCFMHKRQKRKKIQEKTEMVRKLPDGKGDCKLVHTYGALINSESGCRPESVNTNRSELVYERASEDEQSMRTIIEVNPNGCLEEAGRDVCYSREIDGYEYDHTANFYGDARPGILRRSVANHAAGLLPESYGEEVSLGASSTSYSPGIISRRSVDAPLLGSPRRQRYLRNNDILRGTSFQSANSNGGLMSTFVKAESEALITVPGNYANVDGDLV